MRLLDAVRLACALCLFSVASAGWAQDSAAQDDAAEARVKAQFSQRFPGLSVTAVHRTPYGIYEVRVGMDLLYTDEDVTWAMQGPLIDARTRRDVTRERVEKLTAVEFDTLPLDIAVKQIKGDGTRKVAIFEDPNCGYCKQLRKTLAQLDDVTIYTFLYPILGDDSRGKARDVWCAKDRAAVWDDWMLRGQAPPGAQCGDTPEDHVLALGQRLMVRGTPTLFFEDGRRVSGAVSLARLQASLNGR